MRSVFVDYDVVTLASQVARSLRLFGAADFDDLLERRIAPPEPLKRALDYAIANGAVRRRGDMFLFAPDAPSFERMTSAQSLYDYVLYALRESRGLRFSQLMCAVLPGFTEEDVNAALRFGRKHGEIVAEPVENLQKDYVGDDKVVWRAVCRPTRERSREREQEQIMREWNLKKKGAEPEALERVYAFIAANKTARRLPVLAIARALGMNVGRVHRACYQLVLNGSICVSYGDARRDNVFSRRSRVFWIPRKKLERVCCSARQIKEKEI